MNGYRFILFSSLLLTTTFFSSLIFAAPKKIDNIEIFRAKLGCMSCHQGVSTPTEKTSAKQESSRQK